MPSLDATKRAKSRRDSKRIAIGLGAFTAAVVFVGSVVNGARDIRKEREAEGKNPDSGTVAPVAPGETSTLPSIAPNEGKSTQSEQKKEETSEAQPPKSFSKECKKGYPGLVCENPGGKPSPIKITVTDTGDDTRFDTGAAVWQESEKLSRKSRPLKTIDGNCTLIAETLGKEGEFKGTLTCNREKQVAFRPNEGDTASILAGTNANLAKNDLQIRLTEGTGMPAYTRK